MKPVTERQAFKLPRRMQGLQPTLIRQFFERALPDSINFGLGEPDLPTPQFMRDEAARVAVRLARIVELDALVHDRAVGLERVLNGIEGLNAHAALARRVVFGQRANHRVACTGAKASVSCRGRAGACCSALA